MESGLLALVALLGRPTQVQDPVPADSPAWADAEFRLGLSFPLDFKELLATFGQHAWGGFLHVLGPAIANENLDLERRGLAILGGILEIRRKEPDSVPFAVFPEQCGLFPWGVTDNGDTLLWLTQGPPDYWLTVIVAARDPEYERHQCTATALLSGFLTGDLESAMLLDPFEGQKPLLSDLGWSE